MIREMFETILRQMATLERCAMGDLQREQARRYHCAVALVRSVVDEMKPGGTSRQV